MTVLAFLALGANLGDPEAQIADAIARLDRHEALRVLRRARLYRSRPVGPPGQPDYLNTAIEVHTTLEPLALLEAVKRVEQDIGRTQGVRWGPRVIDVDIALYGDRQLDHPRLVIPHPQLARRRFVLAPLQDLDPDRSVPGLGPISDLLDRLEDDPGDLEVYEDEISDREGLGLAKT